MPLRPTQGHPWDLAPREARELQSRLAGRAVLSDRFGELRQVAGIDVHFDERGAVTRAAVAVLDLDSLGLVEQALARRPTTFPYVPGLLSFREIPAVVDALASLGKRRISERPARRPPPASRETTADPGRRGRWWGGAREPARRGRDCPGPGRRPPRGSPPLARRNARRCRRPGGARRSGRSEPPCRPGATADRAPRAGQDPRRSHGSASGARTLTLRELDHPHRLRPQTERLDLGSR